MAGTCHYQADWTLSDTATLPQNHLDLTTEYVEIYSAVRIVLLTIRFKMKKKTLFAPALICTLYHII